MVQRRFGQQQFVERRRRLPVVCERLVEVSLASGAIRLTVQPVGAAQHKED